MFHKLTSRPPTNSILFDNKSTSNFLGMGDNLGKQKEMWNTPPSEPDGYWETLINKKEAMLTRD